MWNGQDPQARLRIRRTCVFPLATYVAVRRGHLEKQLYKELTLLKWSATEKFFKILWMENKTNENAFKKALNRGCCLEIR